MNDEIKILGLSEKELVELSEKMLLSLDLEEMKTIQNYYSTINRNPTIIEIETIAQTWSEHCKHKTFNAKIIYEENNKKTEINSMFKTFIKEPSQKTNKNWLVSTFSDNAGIIAFDESNNIAMKCETHNHPSALDPYGGANTGVGGVMRDILGAGLGARPIANTDVFCFAPPSTKKVPKGILHPKRIFKGVRKGVADYGNQTGVPIINGAIVFEERYLANPLVYCGTIGIIPKGKEKKEAKPGDLIVVIGGRTGKDGIHGATFSSTTLKENSESSAVQIGNAIEEKKMIEAIIRARDLGLYNAITDCGAGGFSSAIGEMGAKTGAKVFLEKAPLKHKGLKPWEIWISESQERMILSVPKQNFEKLKEICEIEGTEATIIGEFTNTKKLELYYENKIIGNLEMEFLHNGLPKKVMKAKWLQKKEKEISMKEPKNLQKILLNVLAMPNIASKEKTVRSYDHEVRGCTIGKPFVGPNNDGPADAGIITPIIGEKKGIVVANGINPNYSDFDPYWMACSSIDEAIRNAIAVGANFEKIALLDNFCWGNPKKEKVLGELVRACLGCADYCKNLNLPFISGKDSLYNEYKTRKKTIEIPGTLLISSIGIIEDSRKKISMPFKKPDNSIYLIGLTFSELGGSQYSKLMKEKKGKVPKVDFETAKKIFTTISKIMTEQESEDKTIMACHDCSEGGLITTIAEMSIASNIGCKINLSKVPTGEKIERNDIILFSESNTRFIVEVSTTKKQEFEEKTKEIPKAEIGQTIKEPKVEVYGIKENKIIEVSTEELKKAWKKTLWW
ncbi:MAG: phosphoribosylformylglycinamidine synthase subunit PurL [Candidatus Diapherotrites archaeon]